MSTSLEKPIETALVVFMVFQALGLLGIIGSVLAVPTPCSVEGFQQCTNTGFQICNHGAFVDFLAPAGTICSFVNGQVVFQHKTIECSSGINSCTSSTTWQTCVNGVWVNRGVGPTGTTCSIDSNGILHWI